MAKLDTTVLVFSPHNDELSNLRAALEPVVGKYREASNFREACQKSQNESVELYILGYSEGTAPVDISDFYHFARENSLNKSAPIYIWGPENDVRIPANKDKKCRFFKKGKFKDLLESLDAFTTSNSQTFIAQKTREGLPYFMRYSIPEFAQNFERMLKRPVAVSDLWQSAQPSSTPASMESIHTRLLEGLCFVEVLNPSLNYENCQKILAPSLDQVMQLVSNEVKTTDSFHTIRTLQDPTFIQKEISEGSWKSIELTHGDSSSPLLNIYIKIKPRAPKL